MALPTPSSRPTGMPARSVLIHLVRGTALGRISTALLLLLLGAGCAARAPRPDIVTTSAARRDALARARVWTETPTASLDVQARPAWGRRVRPGRARGVHPCRPRHERQHPEVHLPTAERQGHQGQVRARQRRGLRRGGGLAHPLGAGVHRRRDVPGARALPRVRGRHARRRCAALRPGDDRAQGQGAHARRRRWRRLVVARTRHAGADGSAQHARAA